MTAFIKNIKEDLNEGKIMATHEDLQLTPEEARRALIITTSKKL